MKFRTSLDPGQASEGARAIKDLVQRHWHLESVGLGNCRAAQAVLRELNEQLLIQSAALANANYNSDEPRDHYGQWTIESAGAARTNSPVPPQPAGPGQTAQSTRTGAQLHTAEDQTKAVNEHATKNPFLHQLFHRALRVLTTFGPNSAGLKELSGLSKATVADAAAVMMRAPEFAGNIRAFILGKEMPLDKALRDSALEQQFRGEAPVATVIGKLSENLAEELPMILGMRALPVGVQKLLTTVFTLKMLKDAPGIATQLNEEFRKPTGQRDYNKIDSLIADAIETLGFTALDALGAKKSSKVEPAEGPTGASESKYSEPETLPTPDDAPDAGAVYAKSPKDDEIALQPYGGSGGGHHVPAKSALRGHPNYDPNKAPAIPNSELSRLKLDHNVISGAQQILYREYAQTGQPLTWDAVHSIETRALIKAGASPSVAEAAVTKAIKYLKASGVSPTRIPWGGSSNVKPRN